MTTTRLTQLSGTKYAEMMDEVEEAQNRALGVQRRIKGMEDQIRNNPASAPEVEHELTRQRSRLVQEQARHIALTHMTTTIRTWLMQLSPIVELQDAPPTICERHEGETYIEAVERLRDMITDLRSAKASVARAVLPLQDLREQADAYVDALGAKAKPSLVVDRDLLSVKHNIEGFAADAIALLAWLDPDAMKSRLHLEIMQARSDDFREGTLVLSRAERIDTLLDLERRALALEREEEHFIREAMSTEKTDITRRRTASPAAILGVEVVRLVQANRKKSAA
jgi:hypothetical protein